MIQWLNQIAGDGMVEERLKSLKSLKSFETLKLKSCASPCPQSRCFCCTVPAGLAGTFVLVQEQAKIPLNPGKGA